MNFWVMFDAIGLEQIISEYVFPGVVLLISLWLHEYAHAWTSYKLWDPTPVLKWRLTLNPLKHIDIYWLLCMIFTKFRFWWWKPVQYNPIYYKNPIRDEMLTAFAWPAMNLVLAFFWTLIIMIYGKILGLWVQDLYYGIYDYVLLFWQNFVLINICLAVFNMIPLAPLDWYRLVKVFWKKWAQWMERNSMWIYLFLLILIFWTPIIRIYMSVVGDAIYRLFLTLFGLIFY